MERRVGATNGTAAGNLNVESLLAEQISMQPAAMQAQTNGNHEAREDGSFPLSNSPLHDTVLLVGGVAAHGVALQRCWRRTAKWCYVLFIACASLAWMVVHSYFVLWHNDSDLTMQKDLPPYPHVYAISFCLPSIDGVMNLLFAHFELHCPRRNGASPAVQSTVGGGSIRRHRSASDRYLKVALLYTFCLVVFRILCVCFWLRSGPWLILGALIEVLPHIAPFIVMYDETAKMADRLEAMEDDILGNRMVPRKCFEEYKKILELVSRSSKRWQIFVVLSVGMEVFIVAFQSLFYAIRMKDVQTAANISITSLILIEGCYMVFKIWPIVRFNSSASKFAKRLLLRVHESEEPADSENFQGSVWITSMLFSTNPPCLTVFTFAVDRLTIMAMIFSVSFTAISTHVWKVVHLH